MGIVEDVEGEGFNCDGCGALVPLQLRDAHAGSKVACPGCGAEHTIQFDGPGMAAELEDLDSTLKSL
jgi:DNA-directed RNA polymerase subunit RPC12/RpoP